MVLQGSKYMFQVLPHKLFKLAFISSVTLFHSSFISATFIRDDHQHIDTMQNLIAKLTTNTLLNAPQISKDMIQHPLRSSNV